MANMSSFADDTDRMPARGKRAAGAILDNDGNHDLDILRLKPRATTEAISPSHSRSIPLYIGAGGVATASHYAVTVASVEIAEITPVIASVLGFGVGAGIKYWLNYSVTFRSRAGHTSALARYAAVLFTLWALNTALFALFTYTFGLHYFLAQVATTLMLIPPGYLMSRHWVFSAC